MKFCAFYKAFSGQEWIEASIKSIYEHVDAVVISLSELSWAGVGNNKCKSIVEEMAKTHPKIDLIYEDTVDQKTQCESGYIYTHETYHPDYIMLVDSDEIWTDDMIIKAKRYIEFNQGFDAYRTNIYTYIKEKNFRVEPIEPLQPVAFIKADIKDFGADPRCCGIYPFFRMEDVYFHHFPYVRNNFDEILIKLINSHTSEKQEHEPLDYWISEKWCKLPNVKNFHPAMKFQHSWQSIKIINEKELPGVICDV